MTNNTQKEISEANALQFALFCAWQDKMLSDGKEEIRQRKEFAEIWGVHEKSPLALMYSAFVGGLDAGADMIIHLEELEKVTAEPEQKPIKEQAPPN